MYVVLFSKSLKLTLVKKLDDSIVYLLCEVALLSEAYGILLSLDLDSGCLYKIRICAASALLISKKNVNNDEVYLTGLKLGESIDLGSNSELLCSIGNA